MKTGFKEACVYYPDGTYEVYIAGYSRTKDIPVSSISVCKRNVLKLLYKDGSELFYFNTPFSTRVLKQNVPEKEEE